MARNRNRDNLVELKDILSQIKKEMASASFDTEGTIGKSKNDLSSILSISKQISSYEEKIAIYGREKGRLSYDQLKNLSQELGLISGLPPASQRQLISDRLNKKLKNPTNLTSGFAIYTPQGNLILQTSPSQLNPTLDRAVLKKVLDFNSSVINQPVQVNNEYLIQFVAPIRDLKTQKIQAILISQIPISKLRPNFATGNYVISDANIFVISHKGGLEDKFESVITVDKKKNFSSIV